MALTLLQIVQMFSMRTGIASPSFVAGNLDKGVSQLQGLIGEVLEELVQRQTWAGVIREALFNTVAAEDQGAITTIAPSGFRWILNETIFDRTRKLPIFGPVSPSDWQALLALPSSGPFSRYRLVRGRLLINPTPPAAHACAFDYSSNFCVNSAAGQAKDYPTADSDTFLLEDAVILAGLRWKWKYEKGLEYSEDFNRFEEFVNNSASRDGTKPQLSMDEGQTRNITPGIFIPSGNWNVP